MKLKDEEMAHACQRERSKIGAKVLIMQLSGMNLPCLNFFFFYTPTSSSICYALNLLLLIRMFNESEGVNYERCGCMKCFRGVIERV